MSKMKRKSCDDGWWQRAIEWVQQHQGGEIHETVRLSDDRQPFVESGVKAGTQLLRIPFSCLVSRNTVESTTYGRKLIDTIESRTRMDASPYHTPIHDLVIALYFAKYPSANETTKFQAYLDTLPEGSSYDNLPRRWNEDQLRLLTGSPLLERIQLQKKGIRNDFDWIQSHWEEMGHQVTDFPSFPAFSDRLAAVTSRAFAGFGCVGGEVDDCKIAMVPLLDLCDHHRGKNRTKNVTYQRSLADGSIVVTAHQDIPAGETLRITYGSQSNARLLLNYGFCIENNMEPDGSSNDILEFQAESGGKVVDLRSGPRSYSLHGFINALDMFYQQVVPQNQRETEDIDEFEQNEKDFDEWHVDMSGDIMGAIEGDDDDAEEDEDDQFLKREEGRSAKHCSDALASFEKRLNEVRGGYYLTDDDVQNLLAQNLSNTSRRYAAILVQAEFRTIYFMFCVIHELQQLLADLDTTKSVEAGRLIVEDDIQLIANQAKEVSAAFMAIRLPGFKVKKS